MIFRVVEGSWTAGVDERANSSETTCCPWLGSTTSERAPRLIAADSSRLVSISKDGETRLWGTDTFRRHYQWTQVYQSEPITETFYWMERRPRSLEQAPRGSDPVEIITLSL